MPRKRAAGGAGLALPFSAAVFPVARFRAHAREKHTGAAERRGQIVRMQSKLRDEADRRVSSPAFRAYEPHRPAGLCLMNLNRHCIV
jgi:hypothetical protein